MVNPVLRPAFIVEEKGKVHALVLVEIPGSDALAVPTDLGYKYIGDVFEDDFIVQGMKRTRWFATTRVDSRMGPFDQKQHAVAALAEWNHLRKAEVSETIDPLF